VFRITKDVVSFATRAFDSISERYQVSRQFLGEEIVRKLAGEPQFAGWLDLPDRRIFLEVTPLARDESAGTDSFAVSDQTALQGRLMQLENLEQKLGAALDTFNDRVFIKDRASRYL
jgi:hypothetical protein